MTRRLLLAGVFGTFAGLVIAVAWADGGPVAALLLTGGLVLLAVGIWAGEDRGAK